MSIFQSIKKFKFYRSNSLSPFENLALEEKIASEITDDEYGVLFYVNKPSVVFGRFQIPWREINLTLTTREKINIARRKSGGGCVYHDLGNLNFCFFSTKKNFSKEMHFQQLLNVFNLFKVPVEIGQKDDLLLHGKKITGSAFRHSKQFSYHHGTLLFNADLKKLNQVLRPENPRFETKAINSRRAEVINICDFEPNLKMSVFLESFKNQLAFCCQKNQITLQFCDIPNFHDLSFSKSEWIFNESPKFSYHLELNREAISIEILKGKWCSFKFDSSTLHVDLITELGSLLKGQNFNKIILSDVINKMQKKWPEYISEFQAILELIIIELF